MHIEKMFKSTLAFLLVVVLVATIQGQDQCCTNMQNSLAGIRSDLQTLTDLSRKAEPCSDKPWIGSCPDGFIYLPLARSCYKVVYEGITWASATSKCQQLHSGAHLAAITSQEENDALKSFLRLQVATNPESAVCELPTHKGLGKTVWTSGQRLDENSCIDPFVWKLSGDEQLPFVFTDWIRGQPDCAHNREQCMHLLHADNYRWNDIPCNFLICALCEYQPA